MDRFRRILSASLPLLMAVIVAIMSGLLVFLNFYRNEVLLWVFGIIAILVTGGAVFIFATNISAPIARDVAIVGFPQSGKTTLIISLFGEAFAGRLERITKMTPKGTAVIERVNADWEMLQRGQALGPTRDQDRFAFRADVQVKQDILPLTYKVNFGDFPGDDSAEYTEKYGNWLHTNEFFKWAADSDAMILVVDLGQYLLPKHKAEYVTRMSSALRAAWQHFLDINEYRLKKVKKHPLVLTFAKADLFGVTKGNLSWNRYEQEILKLGFGKETPKLHNIDLTELKSGQARVLEDFAELISYFDSESTNFKVIFCSCFGLVNGKRLGISDIMQAVLL